MYISAGSDMFLPVIRSYFAEDQRSQLYRIEINVHQNDNLDQYPQGVKSTFRMLKVNSENGDQLVVLVDNHKPFGFHYHDKLPDNIKSRVHIYTDSWQEAWTKFQEICKEILNEL